MKFNPNQRYTRWSIRRLSVGVASVVVASGFFVLVGQPSSVRADGLNPTPVQVLPEGESVTKEGDLAETQGDTVLAQVKPEGLAGNTNSLSTPTEGTEVSEETSPSRLDTLFEKGEEAQENPELTDVLKDAVDTDDVAGTQATPEDIEKAVDEDVKDSIDVPAGYLEQAKVSGPFLAGVNKPLKYELFAGDGMLTRLLLKASDKAPWSDNGKDKNEKIPPVKNLPDGKYYYQVSLNGNTTGKQDQDLLDTLRTNGTNTYEATLTVYEAVGDKPNLNKVVKERKVNITLNGLVTRSDVKSAVKNNIKDSIDVPAAYLEKAKGEGPFTAGVNHVIPYELFAGDGMLTRLLLKASDKAPWSDNGDAKNPALSPLGENVKTKGQYFYQVALDGNVAGKEKQELIDQFRANGTKTYSATVNVYGNKDGKADLTNVVAAKKVTIKINVKETSDTANASFSSSNSGSGVTPMNHNPATGATHQTAADHKDMMAPAKETDKAMPANDQMEKSGMKTETPAPSTTDSMPADTMTSSTNTMAGENMAASANKMSDTMMSDKMMSDQMMSDDKAMLPNTGEAQTSMASIGFLGLALAGLLGGLGLKNKKEEN
ncbi:PavB family fibronectin-binding SSURE repeat adhesin [Streptococcus pseudopneumoniae]|uniref:YSIRK signal domain/LPXTG anchor domain surface protein n=1 Tax=Streptococcus pseudopneumoniae TaxID=257758 RepID=A0A3A4S640_9STRE|nr:PavB family fibronectin-binding SSURE repeat adhesin [Streptococcus pseudopneumoniae]RJP83576.1 YSIRK signal domain/LPXTG anchor domain surface protein [Streptococcus pseudopneumoniae]